MKIIIAQNGGRPLVNDDIVALQSNDELRAEAWLRGLASGAFVLEGCELSLVTGTTYNMSSGVVFVDGKIADIEAVVNLDLATTQYIYLPDDVIDDVRLYLDGQSDVAASTRKAQIIGTAPASETISLVAGQQPVNLRKVLDNASVPVGTVIETDSVASFSAVTGLGSGTWENWALCDGRNGTPDLRGRFVISYNPAVTDYNAVGKTGGAQEVTLTINQMPSHNHSNGNFNRLLSVTGTGTTQSFDNTPNEPNLAVAGTIQATGGGLPHENRPPYYVLAKVKKIA